MFTVLEFALVAGKTTPPSVIIPTNPPRFRSDGPFHGCSSHNRRGWGQNAATQ